MPLAWDSFAAFPLLRWQGPEGIVAAFTSRRGGVSEGPFASLNLGFTTGDDRAAVAENRRRLCAAVGADPARTVQNHQVHGNVVQVAEPLVGGYLDPQGELPQADALITRELKRDPASMTDKKLAGISMRGSPIVSLLPSSRSTSS